MARLFALFLCCLALAAPARAERHALVIGNDAYAELPQLAKAVNDAAAVAGTLQGLGFTVTLLTDAGRRAMTRGVSDLAGQIAPGDEVLFYYAGHGVEIAGRNYLIPADAPAVKPGDEAFLTAESVAVDDVLATLQSRGAGITVLILDACRDNPFPVQGTRSAGGAAGLAPVVAPEGSFILFSAGAGQTALDNLGNADDNPNSVFTRSLLPLMARPDLTLPELARRLRGEVEAVAASVNHKQRPAYYDELTGDYTLAGGATRSAVPIAGEEPPAVQGNAAACAAAAADWGPVSQLEDPVALRAFAATHAACAPLYHAAIAEAERLEGAGKAAAGPGPGEDTAEKPKSPLARVAEAGAETGAGAGAGAEIWRVKKGVSDGYVNARSGPGTMHAILFRIDAGTGGLTATDCRPADPGGGSFDWCLVSHQGRQGWVSKNGLEKDGLEKE